MFCSFDRKFLHGFSHIATLFHELTAQKSKFEWPDHAMEAFRMMRAAMERPTVLTFSVVKKHFHVFTDASKYCLRAALMKKNGKGRMLPVQYASRSLRKRKQTLRTFEREAAAVIFALNKFWHNLLSAAFTLHSDQTALKNAFSKADVHEKLEKWLDMMTKYEFEIMHMSGARKKIADYLSRCLGGLDWNDDGEKLCITNLLRENTIQRVQSQDRGWIISSVDLEKSLRLIK